MSDNGHMLGVKNRRYWRTWSRLGRNLYRYSYIETFFPSILFRTKKEFVVLYLQSGLSDGKHRKTYRGRINNRSVRGNLLVTVIVQLQNFPFCQLKQDKTSITGKLKLSSQRDGSVHLMETFRIIVPMLNVMIWRLFKTLPRESREDQSKLPFGLPTVDQSTYRSKSLSYPFSVNDRSQPTTVNNSWVTHVSEILTVFNFRFKQGVGTF